MDFGVHVRLSDQPRHGENEGAYTSPASLSSLGRFACVLYNTDTYIGTYRIINDQHGQVTIGCLRKSQQQQQQHYD